MRDACMCLERMEEAGHRLAAAHVARRRDPGPATVDRMGLAAGAVAARRRARRIALDRRRLVHVPLAPPACNGTVPTTARPRRVHGRTALPDCEICATNSELSERMVLILYLLMGPLFSKRRNPPFGSPRYGELPLAPDRISEVYKTK